MSFAQEVKNELCQNDLTDHGALAQLGAMIVANGSLIISNKQFQLKSTFSTAMIAKRFVLLIKQLYQIECEVFTSKRPNLRKDYIYEVLIKQKVKLILEDIGLYDKDGLDQKVSRTLLLSDDSVSAYVAGWFLVAGSVNSPRSTRYHCEFRTSKEIHAQDLVSLLKQFHIESKITTRRSEWVVYIKASDKIADILRLIGAHNALMMFEDIRIQRDFHNSLVRLDNCEVANEMKTLKAGQKQVDAIEKLIKHHRLDFLDQKLIDIAHLRLENPELSLNELSNLYQSKTGVTMSKSGIKHRLDKLVAAADKILNKETKDHESE